MLQEGKVVQVQPPLSRPAAAGSSGQAPGKWRCSASGHGCMNSARGGIAPRSDWRLRSPAGGWPDGRFKEAARSWLGRGGAQGMELRIDVCAGWRWRHRDLTARNRKGTAPHHHRGRIQAELVAASPGHPAGCNEPQGASGLAGFWPTPSCAKAPAQAGAGACA